MLRLLTVAALGPAWQTSFAGPIYPDAGTPTQWFLSLDTDQDGYLDDRELRLRPEWAQALAAADRNQDRRIDHSEFMSLLDRMHSRR